VFWGITSGLPFLLSHYHLQRWWQHLKHALHPPMMTQLLGTWMMSRSPHVDSRNSACFFILGRTLITDPWNCKKPAKREKSERKIMKWLKSHTTQEDYKFYRVGVTKGIFKIAWHVKLYIKKPSLTCVWDLCSIYIMAEIRYTFQVHQWSWLSCLWWDLC
jgi:hypothetical protein